MTTPRLVAKGDMTTTRGRVMEGSSTWYADNGQTLARYHDLATCGNCKGLFPILGTARDWMDDGRPLVKHMDRVLCPCRNNRVVASGSSPFVYTSESKAATAQSVSSRPITAFDEQIRATGNATFHDYPYFIETTDGRSFSGRVSQGDHLPRVFTETTDDYQIYWGDDALAREHGTA
ncbi:PAAR domain-containing protein [Paraburkholderia sp. C35]|uniref:PAAR domain-containing protein n=1 Tax=Paraburkholderia sp. C35 TaxID=2126993 RepID=UPI000D69EE73|nr:PAAR domain-containing protein [Paraburkholderia sp. C35]